MENPCHLSREIYITSRVYKYALFCFFIIINFKERLVVMKFNFKEYEIQDITCKGPMRRRYNCGKG